MDRPSSDVLAPPRHTDESPSSNAALRSGTYSTRSAGMSLTAGKSSKSGASVVWLTERQFCGCCSGNPFCRASNLAFVVVAVLLVLACSLLPFLAWRGVVDDRNRELDEQFQRGVAAHATAVTEAVHSLEHNVQQYAVLMRHSPTYEAFADLSGQDEFRAVRVWMPYVRRSERPAFEAQATALYRRVFNDSSYQANITALNFVGDVLVGLSVSPEKEDYSPILFANEEDLTPSVPGRDLFTEPVRLWALRRCIETRETVHSSRIFSYGAQVRVSGALVHPVYDLNNASHLMGIVGYGTQLGTTIADAVSSVAPVSLRLRVFDVSGEGTDQVGCMKPLLFDGVRGASSGEWAEPPVDPSYCPAQPEALVRESDVTQVVHIGGRSWLLIFSPGPELSAAQESLSGDMLILSIVVVVLAAITIGGALTGGLHLVHSLRKSREEVARANQHTKEFLSFITHELRNPLFAVEGTASEIVLTAKDSDVPQEFIRLVDMIQKSAGRMTSIINDVLSVRKLEEGKLEFASVPICIHQLCDEVHSTFSHRARDKDLTLTVQVADTIPERVLGDDARIVQILSNLMSNAIKFTSRGGSVAINAERVPWPTWLRDQFRSEHDTSAAQSSASVAPMPDNVVCVRIDVTDSGDGIPADAIPNLFLPYTQGSNRVARSHGGTGLGLSICKQLAHGMGGGLRVRTRVGKGTTFSLLLPCEVSRSERVQVSSGRGSHVITMPGAVSGSPSSPARSWHRGSGIGPSSRAKSRLRDVAEDESSDSPSRPTPFEEWSRRAQRPASANSRLSQSRVSAMRRSESLPSVLKSESRSEEDTTRHFFGATTRKTQHIKRHRSLSRGIDKHRDW